MRPLLFFLVLLKSFPSPRSFFFSFPFLSLLWFWSFSGLRNMPFDAFSLKWPQISLGRLAVCNYVCMYVCCVYVCVYVCMYVYHRICLDLKYGLRNRGLSFAVNLKRTLRTKIKCDLENFNPGGYLVSYGKSRFCKRRAKFTWIGATRFSEYFNHSWNSTVNKVGILVKFLYSSRLCCII